MPRTLLTTVLALALLAMTGCGDSHDKAAADLLDLTKQIGDTLEGIEKPEDVKPAMQEIEQITEEFEALAERFDALGDPDEETEKQLRERYDQDIEDEIARWQTEAERIRDNVVQNDPALAMSIQTTFMKLAVKMMELGPEPDGPPSP